MRVQTGITLIELLTVLAIIAILAAIGYPAYDDYIVRSQLAEARTALSDMRVRMEQYFQDNRTYLGADTAPAPNPCTAPAGMSNRFTYGCVEGSLSATTYTLEAVGVVGRVNGFRFTVNERNQRATTHVPDSSGWTTNATCWVVRKDGSC